MQGYSRREFLTWAWWVSAGLLAVAAVAAAIVNLWPKGNSGPFGRKANVGKVASFAPASVTYIPDYRLHLVCLRLKDGGTGFLALYRRCTHLGCSVPWVPDEPSEDSLAPLGRFHCPCHGSIYNRYGEVVSGPAPRPLDTFSVTITGDDVVVDTGKIIRRHKFDESQVARV